MADLSCVLTPMGISNPADALVILNAICCGEWTGWQGRRFAADTVIHALRVALDTQTRAR